MAKRKIAKGCKRCPMLRTTTCKGVKVLTALSCQKASKNIYKGPAIA